MIKGKLLYIMRHAEAGWDEPGVGDFRRQLTLRGKRDAASTADRIAKREDAPELVVSSPAMRALTTAKFMAAALSIGESEIVTDERIYEAGLLDLVQVVHDFDAAHSRILLVGHNPGLTELLDTLIKTDAETLPTCGVGIVAFSMYRWADINAGSGELIDFDYPDED